MGMRLRRRQFLWGLGALGGTVLSSCVTPLPTAHQSPSVTPVTAVPSPAPLPAPASPSDQLAEAGIVNPPRGDVRLVVISDLNSQYGSTEYEPEVDRAIALIPSWRPDLVLCGGDMVAGQKPSLTAAQIRAMWAAFDAHVAAPLRAANIPYGFTLGNHDASGALSLKGNFLFAQERDLAAAYWRDAKHNPGVKFVDRAGFPFYYSFEQNGLFFLVWDASTAKIPAEQLAWVEQSLASATAQAAKLRMVIGHLPLYAIAVGREDAGEYLDNAEELRSLLEQYNVHTYISGHHHAYYPGHVGKLQTLHCGILGSGMRPLIGSDLPAMKTLTVIDVNLAAADTVYTTYNAKSMAVVDQSTLPEFIHGSNGRVWRRDITPA